MIAFHIERTFGDDKFVATYSGKVGGDTITGESEGPRHDGQTTKREWVATRAKYDLRRVLTLNQSF